MSASSLAPPPQYTGVAPVPGRCAEDQGDCLVEIAGPRGVEGLVTGSSARFGSTYAAVVRVISAADGITL